MIKQHRFIKCVLILLISLLLTVVFYVVFSSGDFNKVSHISENDIDKIEVQTDWGKNKTITSKQDINQIYNYLNSYNYIRGIFLPNQSGYVYFLVLKKSDKEIGNYIISSSYFRINLKKYSSLNGINIKKLEDIIGLYPPT